MKSRASPVRMAEPSHFCAIMVRHNFLSFQELQTSDCFGTAIAQQRAVALFLTKPSFQADTLAELRRRCGKTDEL